MGYIDAPWLQRQLSEQILSYQQLFEATLVIPSETVSAKLKTRPDVLRERKQGNRNRNRPWFCMHRFECRRCTWNK